MADKSNESDLCADCEAQCCRYVAIEIDKPTCKKDYDHIRWYLLHDGVSVFKERDGSWYVEFAAPCVKLGGDSRCTIYARRPRICRQHGEGEIECEFHADEEPHEIRFETEDEFTAHLDKKGVKWKWKGSE